MIYLSNYSMQFLEDFHESYSILRDRGSDDIHS